MENKTIYYYWYNKNKINFKNLIDIEFSAIEKAVEKKWKLFKAAKIHTLEDEIELILFDKN